MTLPEIHFQLGERSALMRKLDRLNTDLFSSLFQIGTIRICHVKCCKQGIPLPVFWELERLGIHDPIEVQNQHRLDAETCEHFHRTVTHANGRYQVTLPWIAQQSELQFSLPTPESYVSALILNCVVRLWN